MFESSYFILYAFFLALLIPGQDFLLVSKNSVQGSLKIGIFTAFGLSIAVLLHALLASSGVYLVITKIQYAINVIKWLGVLYLVYLGFSCIKAAIRKEFTKAISGDIGKNNHFNKSFYQAAKEGLICNIFNVKAIFFFIALFAIFNNQDSSTSTEALIAKISTSFELMFMTLIYFSFIAYIISHKYFKMIFGKFFDVFFVLIGIMFIVMAYKVANFN